MAKRRRTYHREMLSSFTEPGSLGVVVNVTYRQCYWPALDEPVALFAEGSSGIQVQGPPTPRNVIFPEDTVFLPLLSSDGRELEFLTRSDCFYKRTKEVQEVIEDVLVEREIEVEDGIIHKVEYVKPVVLNKEVEVTRELSVKAAKKHAASRKRGRR